MNDKTLQSVLMALTAFISALLQGCLDSIVPVLIAIIIFAITTAADFFTGIAASKKEGIDFESNRLRKCFNKWLVYLGVFVGTAFLGVLLTIFAKSISIEEAVSTKGLFMNMLKWEIWIAAAIEIFSIVENLHRIRPEDIYISILYYVLCMKIKDKFPEVKDFFIQKKLNKSINNQDQLKQ
jgi:small-conductance mechanosensitive channel